jgi:predicted nucleotidyltransferase
MGLKTSHASLSDALFSGVQQRVLRLLFGQPGRSFYGNELMKLAGSGKGALQRELARLTGSALVTVTAVGNQKRYQANPASPIFEDLCAIVQKTFGLANVVRDALQPLVDRIETAFIYGSIAKKADTAMSDIDLMVVSDTVSLQDLSGVLTESEAQLGRRINATLYTEAEFARRLAETDSFVRRVMDQPKLFLIRGDHDLAESGQSGQDRQAQG